ncbi:MAG TPA: DUF1326 domain-containing protein [Vicinamibacterales bacterium]|nr:DUF1326 domain-containing protein [Vicinamibacterales bacterium]
MASPSWHVSGQYFETCSCDFVCPCILGQMAVRPSRGSCTFAMAMRIDRGTFDSITLDGLTFIILGYTPQEMGKGNWSVGLVIDERASAEQIGAITAIASGSAGGPMAPLSGLIGKFLGADTASIWYEGSGVKYAIKAGGLVDMAADGAMGIDASVTDPMFIGNTGHPVSSRLALARASKSHVHALGLAWDDTSGKNNGHFAPFDWRSA